MRKMMIVAAFALALGMAGTAFAATLNPSQIGSVCSGFHFVNQRSGTTTPGSLTADIGGLQCITSPYKVNGGTQHFLCQIPGVLNSASTNLAGGLTLSDCFPTEPPKEECGEKPLPPCK